MNDELIKQVARAVEAADSTDREVIALAAIAAMQPHIAAEREDAARRALEAAVVEVYSECNVAEMIAPIIRAIDPAQFREIERG